LVSEWIKRKISHQFSDDYFNGTKGCVFSWNDRPMEQHMAALAKFCSLRFGNREPDKPPKNNTGIMAKCWKLAWSSCWSPLTYLPDSVYYGPARCDPELPTLDNETPDVPTPDVPTPNMRTPDVPTPDVPTGDIESPSPAPPALPADEPNEGDDFVHVPKNSS